MKKILPILIPLFVISSFGYAQGCPGHGHDPVDHPHKHKIAQKMRFEMLNLNDEQREAIEDARFEARKKIIPLKSEVELKRLDLEKEMKTDEPNRSKIMKIMKEISDLELKIKQTGVDERLKIHSILTPEQREQLKKPLRKVIQKKIIKKESGEEFKD